MSQPSQTSQQVCATIDAALQHPRGWQPVDLRRNDVWAGGMIVIRDEHTFNLVVALIDSHCQPKEGQ